jgi:hypothetical protein
MEISMVIKANDIWPDGPSGMPSQPQKSEIRAWGTWIESIIGAFFSTGGKIYQTRALLNADLTPAANSIAWVMEDPTVANNGIYRKMGATGTGSWVRAGDLPFSFIVASNPGAGAPNAIQATTSMPVSSSALVILPVAATNTASPVTVSFNGGPALTVKTNSGNDVVAGGLSAGMIALGYASGSTFRLAIDQASAAIVAAAEGWANIAQAAANNNLTFVSRAAAVAASINASIHSVTLKGNTSENDGLGGLFADVDNGSNDTFTSADGRSWYSVIDIDVARLKQVPVLTSQQFFSPQSQIIAQKNIGLDGKKPGVTAQRTLSAGAGTQKWVLDSGEYDFAVTGVQLGICEVDARSMEALRPYTFRVYPATGYSLKVDLGEGAVIAGALASVNRRGFELQSGQSVTVIKAAEKFFYVVSFFDVVFRLATGAAVYEEPTEGGEWRYRRKFTAVAGQNTPGVPAKYVGNSIPDYVRCTSITTRRIAPSTTNILPCFWSVLTDASWIIINPNAESVEVDFTVEGLRLWPTSLTALQGQSRSKIAMLEPARQLVRDYTFTTAGQSLAESYMARSSYKGLDSALRSAALLADGHYLDVVNTAVGGTVADKRSSASPGTNTSYWYDTETSADGPILTDALSTIAAAYGAGKVPKFIIFDLGQADSIHLGLGQNTKANFKAAVSAIVAKLKVAAPSIPVYLQTLAGRDEAASSGIQDVRDAQLELLADGVFSGAIDLYDVEFMDTVHPTNDGYRVVGRRMGELVAGLYDPPRVISAVRMNSSLIVATLSKPLNLSVTPIGTELDYLGGRVAGSLVALLGTVASATQINITINRKRSRLINVANVSQIITPVGKNAHRTPGPYAVDAAGNPIKSSTFAVS